MIVSAGTAPLETFTEPKELVEKTGQFLCAKGLTRQV
jgi:hypothetical protein